MKSDIALKLQYLKEFLIIKKSGLFDEKFYLENYASEIPPNTNPLMHYIKMGWRKGKNPSPKFDTNFYLQRNPDVGESGVNPLFHYIRHGYEEGRDPTPTLEKTYPRYQTWVDQYDKLTDKDTRLIETEITDLKYHPNFTIFILADKLQEQPYLRTISSLQQQIYQNWDAFVFYKHANTNDLEEDLNLDPRIKFIEYQTQDKISQALNATLKSSSCQYFCLINTDIILRPHALFMMAHKIDNHPDAKVLYSDEDRINEDDLRKDPYFKPDWNPDLLCSQYYFNNLCVFNREKSIEVEGFRSGFGDCITWDLALRITEAINPDQIQHIPFVLSHKVVCDEAKHTLLSASAGDKAYQKMILAHYARTNSKPEVIQADKKLTRIAGALPEPTPLVSVIIPTKNNYQLLSRCLESVLGKGGYENLEIIIVDNQSDDPKTLAYLIERNSEPWCRVLNYDKDFNFSAINNYAADVAKGEILLFLNNDIEAISSSWISEMVRHAARPSIGAVGAMLYYPNDTIQHAGIILGVDGVAAHAYQHERRGYQGQKQRATLTQNYSAVTAACLMIEKTKFFNVGGFNEDSLPVGYNDVDLCLKFLQAGYFNLWTPFAELYHHESASRGVDTTPQKKSRLKNEKSYMVELWGSLLLNDPAYNPNLSLDRPGFSLAFPPRSQKPW